MYLTTHMYTLQDNEKQRVCGTCALCLLGECHISNNVVEYDQDACIDYTPEYYESEI